MQTSSHDLHIISFDFPGRRLDTGQEKPCRWTGLVKQTLHLIQGLAPDIGRLALTQTSAPVDETYEITLPDGRHALAQGIMTTLPDGSLDGKSPDQTRAIVGHYYEARTRDADNPLLRSLAGQMAKVVRHADIPALICQNPNPAVSLLKAEELGFLDPIAASAMSVVIVIHDTGGYQNRLAYIRDRVSVSRMAIRIVAVSEQVREALADQGVKDVTVIPNGIDVAEFESRLMSVRRDPGIFDALSRRNMLPSDSPLVLVAARRAPHKGHLDVIEACQRLATRGRLDMTVAFTGASANPEFQSYQDLLREEIERAGLAGKIILLDRLNDLELAALFDRASAAVHASTEKEGFNFANIEAMLAGTPVIASRLGGPLSYIDHGQTGLLVEPGDPKGMADALERLLTDETLRSSISAKAQSRARDFTIAAMASGYKAVLAANRPRHAPKVSLKRRHVFIGEGTNAITFARSDHAVIQMFKADHLSIDQLGAEYRYLRLAYAAMPDLVPRQRFCRRPQSGRLQEALLVKERIIENRKLRPLHLLPDPDPAIRRQMHQFLDITRRLFDAAIGDDQERHYTVPDFIDPRFRNLVIDKSGKLRLLDTNWLMNTGSLKLLIEEGLCLDVEKRPKIALLFRRLLLLENRFRGMSRDALRGDPFFNRYLDPEAFTTLFAAGEAAGEAFL